MRHARCGRAAKRKIDPAERAALGANIGDRGFALDGAQRLCRSASRSGRFAYNLENLTPIGPCDTPIAGEAKARSPIVVTDNVREYSRVTVLKLEEGTS